MLCYTINFGYENTQLHLFYWPKTTKTKYKAWNFIQGIQKMKFTYKVVIDS